MLIERKPRVRVLPDRVHRFPLIARKVPGVVGTRQDEFVRFGDLFVELDRTPAASTRIEEINDGPSFRKSVGGRQVERVALRRVRCASHICDLSGRGQVSRFLRLRECALPRHAERCAEREPYARPAESPIRNRSQRKMFHASVAPFQLAAQQRRIITSL